MDEQASHADPLAAKVEALLMATERPLTAAKLAEVTDAGGQAAVRKAIEALNARYEQTGASFRVNAIAGGFQVQTLPEFDDLLSRLLQTRKDSRLSQAAIETLAIIAYRQPMLRVDIEAIRGVACGEVLRGLIEKQLVKIVGRADVLGRPMLYGTTKKFLEVFGLPGLDDLPNVEELRAAVASATQAPADDNTDTAPTEAVDEPSEEAANQPAAAE